MPQFSTSGTSVSTTQFQEDTTIPYWTTEEDHKAALARRRKEYMTLRAPIRFPINQCNLNGSAQLSPGTSYTVTVSAIQYWTHGFNTSDSLLVNLAPEPPVFADVIYHNTTSVFVYWYPGCTDYDTFEVTYVCEDSPFALTENVTYPNITIFDLPSNSTCFIDIETISNGLRSATKYPLQIKTPPDHCASSPCGINGTNCRSHIDGYLCTCPSEPGEDLTTADENVFSSTVLYTTPAYTLDISLDVVDFGSRRINVTWSITEHPWYSWIDYNFEITYESCAVESTQCHECYSIEMDGLLPGTLYVVHVKAIDIYDSRTTTSNSLLVRTVPESPVNVSVWYLTSSSFEVRADFPDDMNGQDIEITYWPMNEANNSRTVKGSIINGINSSETYALSVVAVSGELRSEPYLLYTTDHCVSDPCHGEASCQSTHDLFICRCPIDRKGDRCQYGMLLLEDLRAESNGHGTIELTVYVDNCMVV
ncbi:receptor-type tyrosine-protein phosphatase eta-like [Ptychodera flava]|uniref:receptor-type tyrosine-protein phosphatase eta-like n=1 Tax=Ptychodera flava TaxID=63121 RepID=UPI003969F6AE